MIVKDLKMFECPNCQMSVVDIEDLESDQMLTCRLCGTNIYGDE